MPPGFVVSKLTIRSLRPRTRPLTGHLKLAGTSIHRQTPHVPAVPMGAAPEVATCSQQCPIPQLALPGIAHFRGYKTHIRMKS